MRSGRICQRLDIHKLDAGGSLKGYLLCIARNTAINRYHELKKHSHVPLELEEFVDGTDVELAVMNDETLEELQGLITRIDEPDREIVIRKYFLFESLREIGFRLGLGGSR